MPHLNVDIPESLEAFIRQEMSTGRYGSVDEIVRVGLRLLREAREDEADMQDALRREIELGLEDERAGRISDKTILEIAEEVRQGRRE